MSVLISVKKGDTIYMGADTQTTVCGRSMNQKRESNLKIHKYKNGLLLGHVGNVASGFRIYSCNELFEDIDGELTKEYIVTSIVPKIIEILAKNNLIDDEKKTMNGTFVIAYKDKAFRIYEDFKVVEGDLFVVGCGEDSSFPYLFEAYNSETINVNDVIIQALRASAKIKCFVGAPFVFINTKDLKFNFVKE